MPYSKVEDLPPGVRGALPAHGQAIYLAAYNSAAKQYGADDEAKLAAVAWSAVKSKYKRDRAARKWVLKESVNMAKREHVATLKDAGLFKSSSLRRVKHDGGIDAVKGKLKTDDSLATQRLHFDAGKFSADDARAYLKAKEIPHSALIEAKAPEPIKETDAPSQAEREKMDSGDFVYPKDKSYPIRNQEELDKAVHAFGRGKHASEPGAFERFKRRVIAIARRKKLTLPKAWDKDVKEAAPDGSYEDVQDGIRYALADCDLFPAEMLGVSSRRPGLRATFDDHIIVQLYTERDEEFYSVPYAEDADGDIQFGDPTEVDEITTYEPMTEVEEPEASEVAAIAEAAQVCRTGQHRVNVVIEAAGAAAVPTGVTKRSGDLLLTIFQAGPGDNREYMDSAINDADDNRIFEGSALFRNHSSSADADRGHRATEDLQGKLLAQWRVGNEIKALGRPLRNSWVAESIAADPEFITQVEGSMEFPSPASGAPHAAIIKYRRRGGAVIESVERIGRPTTFCIVPRGGQGGRIDAVIESEGAKSMATETPQVSAEELSALRLEAAKAKALEQQVKRITIKEAVQAQASVIPAGKREVAVNRIVDGLMLKDISQDKLGETVKEAVTAEATYLSAGDKPTVTMGAPAKDGSGEAQSDPEAAASVRRLQHGMGLDLAPSK